MSGALGALGGGIGFGAGKGLQWAAKTKIGEAIMVRATKHASMIPIGQHLAQGAVGSVSGAATGSLSGAATGGLGSLATGGDVWQGIRQGAWNGAKDGALGGLAGGAAASKSPATVTLNGTEYPAAIPRTATRPANRGAGTVFTVPKGTPGLHPNVVETRVMAPKGGRYPYPNGYVNYLNKGNQAVHPATGRTLSPSDPAWHIPLEFGQYPALWPS